MEKISENKQKLLTKKTIVEMVLLSVSSAALLYARYNNDMFAAYGVITLLAALYLFKNLIHFWSTIRKVYSVVSIGIIFTALTWWIKQEINSGYGISVEYLEYSVVLISSILTILVASMIFFGWTLFLAICEIGKGPVHFNFDVFLQVFLGLFLLISSLALSNHLEKNNYINYAIYLDSYEKSDCVLGLDSNEKESIKYIRKNSKECYKVEYINANNIKYTCIKSESRQLCES